MALSGGSPIPNAAYLVIDEKLRYAALAFGDCAEKRKVVAQHVQEVRAARWTWQQVVHEHLNSSNVIDAVRGRLMQKCKWDC